MKPIFVILCFATHLLAGGDASFKVVVLGAHGGPRENNLSSYLLATQKGTDFIALDAGSLLNGIYMAHQQGSFDDVAVDGEFNVEGEILRNHVKAYLISHAHLDHIAGLVINSPSDVSKPIFGVDSTIDFIRDYVFNWLIWPNFGSEGKNPLNQYHYQRLKVGQKISIPNTEMSVEPFLLNHPGGYLSSAFLVQAGDAYVLYFGDTSPDALESEKRIEAVWKKVVPLIQQNLLKCIFIECSYADTEALYGHLDAKYLMEELSQLAALVDPVNPSINNCKVVVSHIKESLAKGPSSQERIEEELGKLNSLGFEFIFPKQGEKIEF